MTVGDMLKTLRTLFNERVEIRDVEGNEILTCPASSKAIIPFEDCEVTEWFPHGAPHKDATFTVYVSADDMNRDEGHCDTCKNNVGYPASEICQECGDFNNYEKAVRNDNKV